MLRNIRAFVAAVDAGSVNRAARQLALTQPAVTRRIQNLENELGVALLDRRTRPPALTAEGKLAYEQGRRVLAAVDELRHVVAGETEPRGEIRLGVTQGIGDVTLREPIARLRAAFPQVALKVQSAWTPALLDRLQMGQLDAAVVMLPRGVQPPAALEARQIGEQRIVVVAPRSLDLPARPTLADLAGHPWVLNPEGCGYRHALRRALQSLRAPFEVAAEIHGPEIQLSLVADGLGLGLVPGALVRRTAYRKKLKTVEPKNFDLKVKVWIARQGFNERLAKVVDAFAEAMTISLSARR